MRRSHTWTSGGSDNKWQVHCPFSAWLPVVVPRSRGETGARFQKGLFPKRTHLKSHTLAPNQYPCQGLAHSVAPEESLQSRDHDRGARHHHPERVYRTQSCWIQIVVEFGIWQATQRFQQWEMRTSYRNLGNHGRVPDFLAVEGAHE